MQINKDIIRKFNPCEERFVNFLEYYSDFNGSFDEFVDLENITYEDKIWVAKRVLNKNQLVHFGMLCAENVLHIFESKYPEDKRVRECIEAVKAYLNNEITKEELKTKRNAAASAANSAYDAAYYAVASAADAAAYAAAYVTYAASAAAYAASAVASAAVAANSCDKLKQQKLNLELLKMAASL